MKKTSAFQKYSQMTTGELAAATAEFDSDFDDSQFKPLDADAKKRWERARRKRGRPPLGKGAKVVSISLERGLLEAADKLAKRLGVSRARLVAKGLETVISEHSGADGSEQVRRRKRQTG